MGAIDTKFVISRNGVIHRPDTSCTGIGLSISRPGVRVRLKEGSGRLCQVCRPRLGGIKVSPCSNCGATDSLLGTCLNNCDGHCGKCHRKEWVVGPQ